MLTYEYNGPVFRFGRMYIGEWKKAVTKAVSPEKARSNLEYRYKVEHDFLPNSAIRLDQRYLKVIEEPVVTVNPVVLPDNTREEYHQMTIFELLEA